MVSVTCYPNTKLNYILLGFEKCRMEKVSLFGFYSSWVQELNFKIS